MANPKGIRMLFRKMSSKGKRWLSHKSQMFEIKNANAKNLPIFEYGVSKSTYKRVYAWGNTKTGALGIPYIRSSESYDMIKDFHRPKRLGFGERNEVWQVACGFGFTLFSVKEQKCFNLYGTGLNSDSQIGYHEVRKSSPLEIIFSPKLISLPFKNHESAKITKISAGRAHSLILTNEGLFILGNNAYGQCSRPYITDEDFTRNNIHYIENLEGKSIVDINCGQDHSLALTEDGCVYSCGWGADGQTGLGHFNNCFMFSRVQGDIATEKIIKIHSRCDFVMALNDKGQVFGWGNTEYGQITLPTEDQQVNSPIHMKNLEPIGKVKDIAAGGSFCMALNENHEVFTWGYGLLGVGPNVERSLKPIKLPEVLFGKNQFQPKSVVEKITCGVSHAFAITSTGDLYSWGRNRNGCLGLGDEKDQFFPLKVCLGGVVKNVYCGIDHSIAVCKPFV